MEGTATNADLSSTAKSTDAEAMERQEKLRRQSHCRKCRAHGITVPLKGHCRACPFYYCACELCRQLPMPKTSSKSTEELDSSDLMSGEMAASCSTSPFSDITVGTEKMTLDNAIQTDEDAPLDENACSCHGVRLTRTLLVDLSATGDHPELQQFLTAVQKLEHYMLDS